MVSEVESRTVRTPDGRDLCVEIAGPGARWPVLVHHGTPSSRHSYVRWIEDAAARDIKLIGYDRPGYGGSSPQPGRSVADCAGDVQAIADALGIERLAVWGLSGGGPHALACAALLPELVVASGLVASVAPWQAPGLDYFDGMGEENVEELQLYFSDREESRRKSKQLRDELVQVTADQLASTMETLLSPA